MDSFIIYWLILAGPVWAIIGAYLVPLAYERKEMEEPNARVAGAVSGFALGPLGVGFLSYGPTFVRRWWMGLLSIIGVLLVSQVIVRVDDPVSVARFWLLFSGPLWAAIGAFLIPRRYRELGLDDANTMSVGALGGFALGPVALAYFWYETPKTTTAWLVSLGTLGAWQLYTAFALQYPDNLCTVPPFQTTFLAQNNYTYLTQQTINGLVIGTIYALMAVGLTLIYSVQGIVSFAHGQLYMLGGYFSYYFLLEGSPVLSDMLGREIHINPLFGIPIAGVGVFIIGAIFERAFLRPMHEGLIERAAEYAILITFGFGFFIEYTTLAVVGPFPQRAPRFIEARRFSFSVMQDRDVIFGPINTIGDRTFAMVVGVILIFALLYFLNRTWTGRGLRAVSQDKQAAAVTGINPGNMNTLAFGLGAMLAAMAGAALIPIFAWVPWNGAEMAGRSYVIVVLGGLGSVPGALFGGWIVGVVEAIGSGCYPDPSKGAAYKEAFALVIFALVLLLKPTGLFGREQL